MKKLGSGTFQKEIPHLHKIRCLSRYFSVNALIKNYYILIEYCNEQVKACNNPICKYYLKIMNNPQYYTVTLFVVNVTLCKYLQKGSLHIIDAHNYISANIQK